MINRKLPVPHVLMATVLTMLGVANRTPDPREFSNLPALLGRRQDDQDETHRETEAERIVVQGVEQAPPPVTLAAPPRPPADVPWRFWEYDLDDETHRIVQENLRQQRRQMAALLARPAAPTTTLPPEA